MAYIVIAVCFGLSGGIVGKLKGGSFWLWFLIWLVVGLIFYFSYGRHKSTVALEGVEHVAVRQPPVN